MNQHVTLKRSLTLPQLVLYGLGTTIGAGIYALIGELAGISGYLAPVSFLVASLIAGLTALSFAELSGRYPRCAGAALYVKEGFSIDRLSILVGLLVIAAGLVSASALVNGFVGYLHEFIEMDRLVIIFLVVLCLGFIAAWGIKESVTIAAAITVIEIGGLLLIIVVSVNGLEMDSARWEALLPSMDTTSLGSIYAGSLLAFYAFIGFEDMVDVAEETVNAKRNLPIAIILTLGITTLLYMAIMITSVMTISPEVLATSEAPLALIYEYHTGEQAVIISIIGMFAIINGALIQMIMASRVFYGLSSRGQLPAVLQFVHPKTRTPLVATLLATVIVLILASVGRLATLAEATSVIILTVFSMVNLALWRIKRRDPNPKNTIVFPLWIPIAGFFVSCGFVLSSLWHYIY
ncbi:MAG: amino acid permease [Gammaproteobacteria bacterium]|nr:MAG: amino acid permease [Gammaproteobacteria bacterium]